MSDLHLAYGDLRITVSADHAADLTWLHDFLGPSYQRSPNAPEASTRRIAICTDPQWNERMETWQRQEAAGTLGQVLAHVLDGSDLHLPCQRQANGTLLAWENQFSCFYQVDVNGFCSVLQPDSHPRPRRPRFVLMRAVREIALHHELRRGSLALHASGFVHNSRAVLCAGPRRAGKTTLLTACLGLVPNLQLLANDRVMVSPTAQGWSCRGMATVVSVRSGADGLLPGLHRRLLAEALGPEAGPGEPRARSFQRNDQLMLSPSQFCRGLGTPLAPESSLGAILLPRIDPAVRGMAWQPMPPKFAASLLNSAVFGAAHPHSRSQLFDTPESGPFPDEAQRRALLQHLADTVPCFELVVGRQAYGPDSLGQLVQDALHR